MTDIKAALKAEIDAIKAARDDMPFGLSGETEEMLAVMEDALKALEQRDAQIAALTAENVALKECIFKQRAAVENWNSWADEEDKILNEPVTPATNTAANALRADGAERAMQRLKDVFRNCCQDEMIGLDFAIETITKLTSELREVRAAPPAPLLLPDDVPDMLNLSLEQQTEFNQGFWYGVEKVKRLNSAPPAQAVGGRTMPRHEFAQMVNELRDVPAVQSKREKIVSILHAFNINPAGGSVADE